MRACRGAARERTRTRPAAAEPESRLRLAGRLAFYVSHVFPRGGLSHEAWETSCRSETSSGLHAAAVCSLRLTFKE